MNDKTPGETPGVSVHGSEPALHTTSPENSNVVSFADAKRKRDGEGEDEECRLIRERAVARALRFDIERERVRASLPDALKPYAGEIAALDRLYASADLLDPPPPPSIVGTSAVLAHACSHHPGGVRGPGGDSFSCSLDGRPTR